MSPIRNKPLTVAAISSTVLAVTILGLPSQAATSGKTPQAHAATARGDATARTPGNYDARQLGGTALVRSDRQQVADRTRADTAYYRSLGSQTVVDMDPLTHTVRDLGSLDGFLTGRSAAPARTIALTYVRSHLAQLGLTKPDLSTLRFRQDYVDSLGVHNLSWSQVALGATVFGNGLIVRVTRDGRVLEVQGSPVSGLAHLAAAAPTGTRVTASQARSDSARNVGSRPANAPVKARPGGSSPTTLWSNSDFATRVWFLTRAGLRPGWSTYVQTPEGAFQHVIDSVTGRTLFRRSNTDDANGDAFVYDNYPGADHGGKRKVVNFFKKGWLSRKATFLQGNSVTAFSDVNDDDAIQDSEKTPVPGTKRGAQFDLKIFGTEASSFCQAWVCTWDPNVVRSWQDNRDEATTNGFYLASNFHDYLQKPPISFTPAAGNFTAQGSDPVMLNTLDGADTNNGMPDGGHIDNANMSTPPDGISPRMQMYLFHAPFATDAQDPFVPSTGSLSADVEYHEYTHGLSNRLVIDAQGNSTLNDIQARSMGEAWSDYYAMDYLVTNGFFRDSKTAGELLIGKYVAADQHLVRTMAIDCPPGATTVGCTSGFDGRTGGYTYGDFPTIVGGPEVHGSGEIWGQTLWDLRTVLGHRVADNLITRGMTFSAQDPDFLDMRNGILRADLVAYDGRFADEIWQVFAHRGMGFFAGSIDSADTSPASDVHVPPVNPAHNGVVAGTVTDPTTGLPVQGAVVQVTGQGDQYTTTTNAAGTYAIGGLVPGTYAKVAASGPGYIGDSKPGVAIAQDPANPTSPTDFSIIRDWAAASGGGAVAAFDGPDFSAFGCGPGGAIDLSLSTGWGSTTGDNNGTPTNVFIPKSITLKLPTAVNVDSFQIDPTATCGDGGSASTGAFKIETSPDGNTFTVAATGTFDATNRGHLNEVDPTEGATNVKFVRFTILSNQTPDFATNCPNGAFSGCAFTDLTEIAVFGSPSS
ncbi:MAG: M36 family metallopeptidase [Nocardioides sp.]|nr:M36 family metallopeptidase [Nocardioides sp.]